MQETGIDFFDVFPELEVQGELAELLRLVTVSKVAMNREKNMIRLYLVSPQWIHKKYIYKLEKEIGSQFFSRAKIQIKIIERFRLSRQYTPERLMEVYRDSIQLELKNYNILLFHLFSKARFSYPEPSVLCMELQDTVLGHEKEEELYRIVEKILNERCGLAVTLEVGFYSYSDEKTRKDNEYHLRAAARHVAEQTGLSVAEEETALPAADPLAAVETGAASGEKQETKGEKQPASGQKKGRGGRTGQGDRKSSMKGRGKGRDRDFEENQALSRSSNPDVLYGRDFEDETTPIEGIEGAIGDVAIRGCVLSCEGRELRSGRGLVTFAVTDDTDTIMVKIFVGGEQIKEMCGLLGKGTFVKIKGKAMTDTFDHELTLTSVMGIKKIPSFRKSRHDNNPNKRVELHCHTKMSDMDGVTDAATLVKRAYSWGHKAIAITDHGVVQAFPEANHAMEDIDRKFQDEYKKEHPEASKEELKKVSAPFKVIYGVEAYLVDDLKGIVENSKGQSLNQPYVVFDIETTGFSPVTNKIIEIGAVRVEEGKITKKFSTFVNPQVPIPFKIENLTGINDNMVLDAPTIDKVLPEFMEFCEGAAMVAHNAGFDMSFIEKNCTDLGIEREFTSVDTVGMARFLLPGLNRFKLDTVAKAVGVPLDNHHRAVDDAGCTADIFVKFLKMLKDRDIFDLDQLNSQGSVSQETIRKLPSYHAIILATGETGRVNLYRLVSESHLKYYNRRPKLPKSTFLKYREGLLMGSACEAGELMQALLRGAPPQEIARIVDFYDYLEVQPIGNNAFMIRDENNDMIHDEEDLRELNRSVIRLGEQFKKPVVATCDVHFIDPQDEIYRRIIMFGKGFADADEQAPLYLHTTDEMLEEFSYLGSEKAEEIVITNPQKIADMCDKISPIRAGKFPPVIEDSDKQLREICYNKAHEIYGPDLPQIVEARLERELNSIISNGYAVMYIIAQKLVWKSVEDGYLVGSRGSVGSSFVATMAGITEVNPLSPHYLCESCYYVDFDSPEVKEYSGRAGCDMPDAVCPKCGKPLTKMGFDIPFETFLGFKGNKEPDIDLNFSGEYQSKAHKYTEVIFGAGQTFRAGTIGTLADKTAFGYVKNYYEDKGIHKRNCEIDRIVSGCTGIRRTTGQHPGGIIVLPFGEDINSFTPVQHPANDNETDIITTHFDYHSIDANLLKLDILGHDDPTMIRMLEDLTGLDATAVPLDEPKVMSLFRGTEALGVTPEEIGVPLGCLGVPEFGTDFAMQMLIDTQPKEFSDLVRIAGLAHGTDVWLGNAQTLIQEGKATISTAICTRDDIMTYLINKGLDSEEAFTIMESVRKGKGLKPNWEEEMKAHDVPDWYIWSCKKIKYMFPKAHAAAYVMMAYRIAWFKVYQPLAYYAAFFSIRASDFSYEIMCMGQERLEYYIEDYKKRMDSLTPKEQGTYRDMRLVREMYARGFDFVPVDLYQAQAHRFQIVDGKLMPALDTIDGLGEKAADAVVLAARDGKFLSKDDFRNRTKVSKTVVDLMADLGIFGDLPESNQFSLFDFV